MIEYKTSILILICKNRPGNCQSEKQHLLCVLILQHLQVSAKDVRMNERKHKLNKFWNVSSNTTKNFIVPVHHVFSNISHKNIPLSSHFNILFMMISWTQISQRISILGPWRMSQIEKCKIQNNQDLILRWRIQKVQITSRKKNSEIQHAFLWLFLPTHFLSHISSVTHGLKSNLSQSSQSSWWLHSSMTYPPQIVEGFQHILCDYSKQLDAMVSVKMTSEKKDFSTN